MLGLVVELSPGVVHVPARALQAQLAPTTLGQSFARLDWRELSRGGSAASELGGGGQEAGCAIAGSGGAVEADSLELAPVDLDLNAVEGLLASFHNQQGLPGPASNLAGLLGISLPPHRQPPLRPHVKGQPPEGTGREQPQKQA